MDSDEDRGRRFGPVRLLPGVTPTQVSIFLLADLVTIGFVAFVNISQAYLMNANIGIPEELQGTLSGDLGFWSEVTVIAGVWLAGMLADQTNRRLVMWTGLVILGLSYFLYPFSDSATDLLLSRLVYAAGVAATTCMLTVIVHDYPEEQSRGKLVVLTGICGGLGAAVVGGAGGALPDVLIGAGATAIDAGYYMNWIAAGICLAMAALVAVGIHPSVPGGKPDATGFGDTLRAGIRAAAEPRVRLAYFSAFAARGDMVIAGTFIVLWGTLAGQAQGMDTAEAVSQGTLRFVIFTSMSLVCAPVMGLLLDRFDRTLLLAIGAAFATAGFAAVGMIDDPLDPDVLPLFFLLGIGNAACFFSSQALIGEVTTTGNRGAVVGAFSACGAVGVLVATGIGGRLFDAIHPGAPFLMVAIATACLSLWGLWIVISARPASQTAA